MLAVLMTMGMKLLRFNGIFHRARESPLQRKGLRYLWIEVLEQRGVCVTFEQFPIYSLFFILYSREADHARLIFTLLICVNESNSSKLSSLPPPDSLMPPNGTPRKCRPT